MGIESMKYVIVIPARNEVNRIVHTLKSIFNQTVKPVKVVVVDDGSRDGTGCVARRLGTTVVRVERRTNENLSGTPYIAYLINRGLEIAEKLDLDYVMISGADCVYPPTYVEEITRRMRQDKAVIASGVAHGEVTREYGVRGAGRLIDAKWFRGIGFRYPENYGFEPWLVFRALKDGMKVAVYKDIAFSLLRETKVSPRKAYLWGKAMRALNYFWLYALGRCLLFALKSPKLGLRMLSGYLRKAKKYRDIEDFVPSFQRSIFLRRIEELLGTIF